MPHVWCTCTGQQFEAAATFVAARTCATRSIQRARGPSKGLSCCVRRCCGTYGRSSCSDTLQASTQQRQQQRPVAAIKAHQPPNRQPQQICTARSGGSGCWRTGRPPCWALKLHLRLSWHRKMNRLQVISCSQSGIAATHIPRACQLSPSSVFTVTSHDSLSCDTPRGVVHDCARLARSVIDS